MKKISIFLALLLVLAMVAVPAFADSVRASDDVVNVTVKRADPSQVVKDGVIGESEYERFEVSLDENDSPLNVCFWSGMDVDDAFAMMATMEYYFSWDEVHGFNFAIRNKPALLKQVIPEGTGDPPQDDFCKNVAYTFIADQQPKLKKLSDTLFYYAVAKDTETGAYKEGHYNQLGLKGYYNPAEGVEYCISYDYSTGYSTIEWSVPFDNFVEGTPAAGTVFYFSVGAEAGPGDTKDADRGYAVALGDWSWLVGARISRSHAVGTLSDEVIPFEQESESTPSGGEGGNQSGSEEGGTPGEAESGTPGTVDDGSSQGQPGEGTDPVEGGSSQGGESGSTDEPAVTDEGGKDDSGEEGGTAQGGTSQDGGSEKGSDDGQDTTGEAGSQDGDSQAGGSQGGGSKGGSGNVAKTGDPMIVIAAVSAISAAGAFIVRKRRH